MVAATPLAPLPPPNIPLTSGQSFSQAHAQYFQALDQTVRTGNFPALSVGGNAVLTVAGGATLTGGFNETPFDLGTVTTGTITPNPSSNLKQRVVNNGAFTIAATAEVGDLELLITNGASAGAITFSVFTKQFAGDALDTVSGHKFVVFIYAFVAGTTAYLIKAMQ